MASKRREAREKFVSMLEAGANAMLLDRKPQRVTITELAEFSGYFREQFDAFIPVMIRNREVDLLERIQTTLARFDGLQSKAVNSGLATLRGTTMETAEELKLDQTMPEPRPLAPKIETRASSRSPVSAADPDDDIEIQGTVARMLRRFDKGQQLAIINAVIGVNRLHQ